MRLHINIDHVATVRQARRTVEPDPVWAAVEAQLGGADGITVHLREDRRHIQDDDLRRLRETVAVRLNMEMAATPEMVRIASTLKPDMAMLVPEGRLEVTTEGGLDVASQASALRRVVQALNDAGVPVSMFIEADPRQIDAAAECGAAVCEIHTGPYAHRFDAEGRSAASPRVQEELRRVREAGERIRSHGMQFNAGHALNYRNVGPIAALEGLSELHIGHSIVSRAIFTGMREAVRDMKRLITSAAQATGC